ncbi:MAG: 6,7-dimethyl-8-ribityllumazine synthase [Acidobacteriota bacterium]|nr:6,7-dimethyl-8-ribityllumazine synthase [Acidobacteriota bacterium]
MPPVIEGNLDASGLKIAIIVARFNSFITGPLLAGAYDTLTRSGCKPEAIEIIRVPGAWELPIVVKIVSEQHRHDAIIALGAVIRGDTPHFDYVAAQAAHGIGRIPLDTGIPVAFGVLTTNTVEQAIDRAGAKSGNKGSDAAMTAIEMANLLRRLRQ